jgi:hypothetical protein
MSLGGGGAPSTGAGGGYTSWPGIPYSLPPDPTGGGSGVPIPNGPIGWGDPLGGGLTGGAPPVDYSNFDFANLDLPQWGGAYSAPMTGGQLDALNGFNSLAYNNPIAQTLNSIGMMGGGIQDLGRLFRPSGAGYGTLSNTATSGPGGLPNLSDVSGIQNMAAGMANPGSAPTSDFQTPMWWMQQLASNPAQQGNATQNMASELYAQDIGNSNLTGAQNTIGSAVNTAANASVNINPILSTVGNVLNNNPTASHVGSSNFLNQLFASGGTTPGTSALTNTLTGQLNNSFNDRFDLTPMFQQAENQFNSSLDRNLARVREEYSGLGINPGSSDRIDALGRTVGEATSQFQLGLQDLARQSFESGADRRLAGINTGMNLSNLTQLPQNVLMSALPALMQSESLPLQEQLAVQGQQLGALPTMLDALRTNPMLAQNASSLMLQAGGLQGQLSQVPFAEQMAEHTQRYNLLPSMLGSEQLGLNTQQMNSSNLLNAMGQYSNMIGQNTAERQFGQQNAMSMLPFLLQAQTTPFNQSMQMYQNAINPYADRQLQASMGLMGADQQAMMMGMQAMNQQSNLYGQQYGLNESARGLGDADIQRAMAEFARTQGGTLNQALSLFGMPGLNTGFGPSSLAQSGNLLAGIAGLAGAGMDLYNTFGGR